MYLCCIISGCVSRLSFELLNSVCRERILDYRVESQKLDQCSRLYDSSVSNDGFELDAGHIVQVLSLDIVLTLFLSLI